MLFHHLGVCGPNNERRLFDCHDGRHGGYHFAVVGRRMAVPFGHLFGVHRCQFHRGRHIASAIILVSTLRSRLLPDRTFHVLAAHHLLGL